MVLFLALTMTCPLSAAIYVGEPLAVDPPRDGVAPKTDGENQEDLLGQNKNNPEAGQAESEVIPKFEVKFSEDTTLASVVVWAGRPYGAQAVSVTITSAMPVTNTDTAGSSAYSDAQLGFPMNGVFNLHLGILPRGKRAPQSLGSLDDQVFYPGRELAYDRYYIKWYKDEIVGEDNNGKNLIVPRISSGRFMMYLCDGIGPQVIFRGSATQTGTTQDSGDYGIAADAYIGFGFDGALIGRKKANAASTTISKSEVYPNGFYRLEVTIDGKYVDSASMKRLYPNAASPTSWIGNVCGKFQLSITESLSANIQLSYPIGGCSQFMSRNLFAGISLTK